MKIQRLFTGSLLIITLCHYMQCQERLYVRNTSFIYNNKSWFLNGVNQAWIDYGNDFGNN